MESPELQAIRQRDLHWRRRLTSPDTDREVIDGFNRAGEDRRTLLRILDGQLDPRPQPQGMRALLESLETPEGPHVPFEPGRWHGSPPVSPSGPTDPVVDFVLMRSLQLELSAAEGLAAEHCRTTAKLLRSLALAASKASELLGHLDRTQTYPSCCSSDFRDHVAEWIKQFTVAGLVAPTDGK